MTKKDKLIQRLCQQPKDFTFAELEAVFIKLGFEKDDKGKTSGVKSKILSQRQANAIFSPQTAYFKHYQRKGIERYRELFD